MPEEHVDELMTTPLSPPGGMPAHAFVPPTGYRFGSNEPSRTIDAEQPASTSGRAIAAAVDVGAVAGLGVAGWFGMVEATATSHACGSTVDGSFVVGTCRQLGFSSPWPWIVGVLVVAVVGALYAGFLSSGDRRTLGMAIGGVRVVDAGTGEPLGPVRAGGRFLLGIHLAVVTLGVSWLALLWDDRRRPWHDRVLDTAVVDD